MRHYELRSDRVAPGVRTVRVYLKASLLFLLAGAQRLGVEALPKEIKKDGVIDAFELTLSSPDPLATEAVIHEFDTRPLQGREGRKRFTREAFCAAAIMALLFLSGCTALRRDVSEIDPSVSRQTDGSGDDTWTIGARIFLRDPGLKK